MARLRARNEWKFFAVLPKVHPTMGGTWWGLILMKGALPTVFAIAMGIIVRSVQSGDSLTAPLIFGGTVFVLLQVLPPIHQAISANLGDRTAAWLYDRLMEACVQPPGMGHLEDPQLTADLTVARDFDLGMTGPPLSISMDFIAGGLVEFVAGLSSAMVLAQYRWWAPIVLAGAWLATHWLLRESAIWRDRNTPEVRAAQRHADYAYRLAVDPPAAKELRLFGLAGWVIERFVAQRTRLHELQYQATQLRQKPLLSSLLIVAAANIAVFWLLAMDAASGGLDLGSTVVYAQCALGTALIAFGGLNWALDGAAAPVAAVERLGPKMETAGAMQSGTQSAGKTTLAKLLCRLYDPQAGSIEVDGLNLRDFELDNWRSRVTAVFQDFIRFELPLRDNVAPRGASGADILAALESAGAAGLAGLDTVLARGYANSTDLAGGQWQRGALARALCAVRRGAGLVLLDEPTAQLDVRGEAEIFDRILAATRQCTTVLISHRFSTVRHADRICVLENGKVVELGTHDELMALSGRYRTMFDLQAKRFYATEDEEGKTYDVLT
jgi:ATP-binding cassette, subfamily B, bacterial